MTITKIISGGQTGADRGGLDAAIVYGVPHGGWCPKGRISEDGTIPLKYDLKEMTNKNYLKRTEANVVDSDATVIFTQGKLSRGSKRTVDFCQEHGKPWLHIDLAETNPSLAVGGIIDWLQEGVVLNVAGTRESKRPGIQQTVSEIIQEVLNSSAIANGY